MRKIFLLATITALQACATPRDIPPQASEAVQVLVPVTKACEVAQVENSALPSAGGVPNDLYEAVKRILADRQVLIADREQLQAANSNPCPEVK